jgi:hypothetical protein
MELMQKCFPFQWTKYWNCGMKEFDLLMILQDIDNSKLSVEDRLLLTLLARIWTDKRGAMAEVTEAAQALGQEHRQILAEWIDDETLSEMCSSPAAACPCGADHFISPPITNQKA